jgi:ATP-dependent Clp protease protease subunit
VKAPIALDFVSSALHARPARPQWFEKAAAFSARTPSPIGKPWGLVAAAKKNDPARLYLYDAIGKDPWGGGIDPMDVVKQLAEVKGQDLEIHVNSPGGYVFDGIAIFNAIRCHDGETTVFVDSLAASIASVIALAGDRVVTLEGAQWMVHDPMGGVFAFGTADEIERSSSLTVKALRKIREAILDVYTTETGRGLAELSAWMADETWMNAEEALARGFTDEVEKNEAAEDPDAEDEDEPPGDRAAPPAGAPPPARARTVDELLATARADWAHLKNRSPGAGPGPHRTGQPVITTTEKPGNRREKNR